MILIFAANYSINLNLHSMVVAFALNQFYAVPVDPTIHYIRHSIYLQRKLIDIMPISALLNNII